MKSLNLINTNDYPSTHDSSAKLNNDVTLLLRKIADSVLEKSKPPKKTKKQFAPWFNWSCRQAKRSLKKSARILSKFPKSSYLRTNYYHIKKSYRNLIKHTKLKYFSKLNTNIEEGKILNWNQFKKTQTR